MFAKHATVTTEMTPDENAPDTAPAADLEAMPLDPEPSSAFKSFGLAESVQKALDEIGYITPTPIQAQMIPLVLSGKDVLGQAQTGTGKTAAFALPMLSQIDLERFEPQVLVLAPTRELAIQVAASFRKYGSNMRGLQVLPIYGGQDYGTQLRQLKRGVHVVVGTPGRIMDHLERETLVLSGLRSLVLDEADEMLRMGFKEDVEWILDRTPPQRQIALFSATLPPAIRAIARKYLREPEEILIASRTATVEMTRQRGLLVDRQAHKLEALVRLLEVEPFDGVIVFVRTKAATLELVDQLNARGFPAAPLNGDVQQSVRERTVGQLKSGKLDILVATDVAARGLDVDRISHVINYDAPFDAEAYVHRIGRTGRAGRSGEAILFITPRERRLLFNIEAATRQRITPMQMPTVAAVNARRVERFKERITAALANPRCAELLPIITTYVEENCASPLEVAAALGAVIQGDRPLLLPAEAELLARRPHRDDPRAGRDDSRSGRDASRSDRGESRSRTARGPRDGHDDGDRFDAPRRPRRDRDDGVREEGMVRYRIEVGRIHSVLPGQIVGAIAGESGLDSKYIGRIILQRDYSTVDLPEGMPPETLTVLKRAWVAGRQMKMSVEGDAPAPAPEGSRRPSPFAEIAAAGESGDPRPETPMRGGRASRSRRDDRAHPTATAEVPAHPGREATAGADVSRSDRPAVSSERPARDDAERPARRFHAGDDSRFTPRLRREHAGADARPSHRGSADPRRRDERPTRPDAHDARPRRDDGSRRPAAEPASARPRRETAAERPQHERHSRPAGKRPAGKRPRPGHGPSRHASAKAGGLPPRRKKPVHA